jgi:hypothetical protein
MHRRCPPNIIRRFFSKSLKCKGNPSTRIFQVLEDLGGIPIIVVFNKEKCKGEEFSSINLKAKMNTILETFT